MDSNQEKAYMGPNDSLENPQDGNNANSFPLLVKISPMNKSIEIQYSIFALWSIALFLVLYYITYSSSKMDLIEHNILPENKEMLLIIAAALGGIGLVMLSFNADPSALQRIEFIQNVEKYLSETRNILKSNDFEKAAALSDKYINLAKKYHLDSVVKQFVPIANYAHNNLDFLEYLNELERLLSNNVPKEDLIVKLYAINNFLQSRNYKVHQELLVKYQKIQTRISVLPN